MPPAPSNHLRIFVLNVGQADASVIVTPAGNVIVIDAARPPKLARLLRDLGLEQGEAISQLIITHPHDDHYSGANRLLDDYQVQSVALAPFWCTHGFGPRTYRRMVNRIEEDGIPVQFVSGYTRFYPDGALVPDGAGYASWDETTPYLELVGPSNGVLNQLERSGDIDTNHLSIMARMTWGRFRMVFSADAQMENWAHYDVEGMLEQNCNVLKTAHHGSANGTQWERIKRLGPRGVIVSSDPNVAHDLPDLVGASIFAKLEAENLLASDPRRTVALTYFTGTIAVEARRTGRYELYRYNEEPDEVIADVDDRQRLDWDSNPTDWRAVLEARVAAL